MTALNEYIKECTAFPLLTPAEASALGYRARAGDEVAIELLVTHNLRLVLKWAFKHPGDSIEDRIQLGNMALMRAARTFDPSKSKFSTYAIRCITNAFHDEHLAQRRVRRIPKEAQISDIDPITGEEYMVDQSPSPEEVAHHRRVTRTLKEWIDDLPELERYVILNYYDLGEEATRAQRGAYVSERLLVSRQWVDQVKQRGLSMLRRRMMRYNLTLEDLL